MKIGKKTKGFTLIEVMVVVAIIAILATVAIPSYRAYIDKTELNVAKSDIMTLSLVLENAYQKQLAYPEVETEDTEETVSAFGSKWKPSANMFEYVVESTKSGYRIEAVPTKDTIKNCKLWLESDGSKGVDGGTEGCDAMTEW